jgi:hypothetical protein
MSWLAAGTLIDIAFIIYLAAITGWKLGTRYWARH